MSEMISQCPKCMTSFRVTNEQLQMASGKVRCGYCMNVFMGGDFLISGTLDEAGIVGGLVDEDVLRSLIDPQGKMEEDLLGADLDADALDIEIEAVSEYGAGAEIEFDDGHISDDLLSSVDSSTSSDHISNSPQLSSEGDIDIEGTESNLEPDRALVDQQIAYGVPQEEDDDQWARELLADLESSDDEVSELDATLADLDDAPSIESAAELAGQELDTASEEDERFELTLLNEGSEPSPEAQDRRGSDRPELGDGLLGDELGDTYALASSASQNDRRQPEQPVPLESDRRGEVSDARVGPDTSRRGDDLLEPTIDIGPFHGDQPLAAKPIEWKWLIAALSMLALLVLQYFFFYWADLARSPSSRPTLTSLCGVLGCELPAYRDLARISTEKLTVRTHPDVDDALIIDVILSNEAELIQPFPVLQLNFFNIRSQALATRKFFPGEYLHGELRGLTSMPSRTPIRIALEVIDPGPDAKGYELNILPGL